MSENKLLIEQIDSECTGCGVCANVCPKHCITMGYDEEGFLFPHVDKSICIDCKLCERSCHAIIPLQNQETEIDYYMGWHQDESIREASSSGGAFTLFAEYVIKQGGIVFASRYNGDMERLEFSNTDLYPLSEFRKSRYIESNTVDVFGTVKTELKKGRIVLFCGTPCHISALIKFLKGQIPSNLITMDFICHGVPSNYNFSLYKKQFEKENNKIVGVDFRYKNFKKGLGWHSLNLALNYTNGKGKILPVSLCSFYMTYFDRNHFLRKSCYRCTLINKHLSDVTIADFWGIVYHNKDLDDNKGISLLLLRTAKIKNLFDLIRNNGFFQQLPASAVDYAFKPRTESSSYSLVQREITSANIKKFGYTNYIHKLYAKKILKQKIKNYIKCLLKR